MAICPPPKFSTYSTKVIASSLPNNHFYQVFHPYYFLPPTRNAVTSSNILPKIPDLRYSAQSKAVTTEIVRLGVDTASMRTQVAPVGSRTSRSRPPEAIRRTFAEVAVGTVVVTSTQELERPFVNTVVVGEKVSREKS